MLLRSIPLVEIRHASCCGKRRYSDASRATEGITETLLKYGEDGEPLTAYYCVFCNHHHLGRRPKSTTLRFLSNISALLMFDFNSLCEFCAKAPKGRPCPPQELLGRAKKVAALIPVLARLNVADVSTLKHSDWIGICKDAGIKPKTPSENTLAAIKHALTQRGTI